MIRDAFLVPWCKDKLRYLYDSGDRLVEVVKLSIELVNNLNFGLWVHILMYFKFSTVLGGAGCETAALALCETERFASLETRT